MVAYMLAVLHITYDCGRTPKPHTQKRVPRDICDCGVPVHCDMRFAHLVCRGPQWNSLEGENRNATQMLHTLEWKKHV